MSYIERYGVEPAAVALPPAQVIERTAETIRALVIVPEGTEYAIAIWVIHTYLIEPPGEEQTILVSPILNINAPDRQCGKSILRAVLAELCPRPMESMSISEAAFYRVMERNQPTLFIDEADTFLTKREQLVGVLNAGYRPDGVVTRMGGRNYEDIQTFRVWGAKVIVGIGDLPDTLSSRCIHIRMKRKLPDERVMRLNESDSAAGNRQTGGD